MKVFLDSVGCRLNQSEIERFANQFRVAGHEIVGAAEDSDIVIINTCTVTAAAASDSRARIRQAHRRNPHARILLTGCWSTLEPEAAQELPGVSAVIGNDLKDDLVPHFLQTEEVEFDLQATVRRPIPGSRMRTRAFIKAQDGCDNQCTFCVTTIARGPARSVPPQRIIKEIDAAIAGGVQEAVLTGVQLTAYGKDLPDEWSLKSLIEKILDRTDIPRLRLSSLEPWALAEEFFELWQDPRLCRQLHLPLQSGSPDTLRRMGRSIDPQRYRAIVAQARQAIPDVAITTDIMVGFPGEDDEAFDESLRFIGEMQYARAHVFIYSPRPGTLASRLPGKIPRDLSRERSRLVRQIVQRSALDYKRRYIGRELVALWESAEASPTYGWEMRGLTDNYLRVRSSASKNLWNRLTPVRIVGLEEDELRAEVLSIPTTHRQS
jgi:threonylcarbamoyladenosine tRNA methylthiotransferase MtaB